MCLSKLVSRDQADKQDDYYNPLTYAHWELITFESFELCSESVFHDFIYNINWGVVVHAIGYKCYRVSLVNIITQIYEITYS